MLKAIIIDDSNEVISSFEKTLNTFFTSEITVLKTYNSPLIALEELNSLKVDIIFLDIEMPEISGFDFIDCLTIEQKNKVILVTAHDLFAIKAIKNNLRNFLTKPIVLSELKQCIENIKNEINENESENSPLNDLVMIIGHNKTQFFNYNKIIRVQANGNYCILFYGDKQISVSKHLKYFEEKLPKSLFYRFHRSHLINLNHLQEIKKGNNGITIFMKDGSIVEILKSKNQI